MLCLLNKSLTMIAFLYKTIFILFSFFFVSSGINFNDNFQGKATYVSKTKMELGSWGARMSEAQKKQIAARLKNRLEKEFTLIFNKEESVFIEEEQLDAISGATDSWGKNFAAGDNYKNVKLNTQIQQQEFYGKKFLVKDNLQDIQWTLLNESKKIGDYVCYKAKTFIPTDDLQWYSFSWSRARSSSPDDNSKVDSKIDITEIEAWYTPEIPVRHGPSEYWGLPGLILEVSTGQTIMLCTKVIINPIKKSDIEAPGKGSEINKDGYQELIQSKMAEFRNNRMRR